MKRAEVHVQQRNCPQNVLIVDDNPAIRQLVSQAFRLDGFVCREADGGIQAIELAKESVPDLIVLDLSMPVMNGLQAAPQLRRIAPRASIILLTMYSSEVGSGEATRLGIDLVVSKTEALSSVLDKAYSLGGHLFHRSP